MSFTDIFKKIFGSKAERDLKQLRPILDKVLAAYETVDKLSDDQLRAKTEQLKKLIADRISADRQRIEEIKAELEKDIPVEQKEKLASESDKLTKKVDEEVEAVLNEILPEAFAVMKSTARRFKENAVIEVAATDFDRDLAATRPCGTTTGWPVETKSSGIWFTTTCSSSVVSCSIRARLPRWPPVRERPLLPHSRFS